MFKESLNDLRQLLFNKEMATKDDLNRNVLSISRLVKRLDREEFNSIPQEDKNLAVGLLEEALEELEAEGREMAEELIDELTKEVSRSRNDQK